MDGYKLYMVQLAALGLAQSSESENQAGPSRR